MFTGIITELGQIKKMSSGKTISFQVSAGKILGNKKIGQSIAVNGACVSIKKIGKNSFEFDAMPETLRQTNLDRLKIGDKVNLEPPLRFNGEIDGHLVLGHIDTTATVISFTQNKSGTRLTLKTPPKLQPYISRKGSICVNGVSLTISAFTRTSFSVDLIPLTLKHTNLAFLKKNDKVNIEVDMIARYLKKLANGKKLYITKK